MADYIKREDFISRYRKLFCEDCNRRKGLKNRKMRVLYEIGDAPCRACDIGDMLDYVENAPAADVVEVRHGKNIGEDYDAVDQFVCSECGIELQGWYRVERDMDDGEETYHEHVFRYCPNCGAKMDGGEDDAAD